MRIKAINLWGKHDPESLEAAINPVLEALEAQGAIIIQIEISRTSHEPELAAILYEK